MGVCAAAGDVGDCCSASAPCKPAVHCNEVTGICSDESVQCQPCKEHADCAVGSKCDDGLHVCVPTAPSCGASEAAAAPCGVVEPESVACGDDADCPPGWSCPWPATHCKALLPHCGTPGDSVPPNFQVGEYCWDNDSCAAGLVCEAPPGYYGAPFIQIPKKCAPVVEPGAACATPQVCPPGTTCDGGHCVPPQSLSPCSCDAQCAPAAVCELLHQPDVDGVCVVDSYNPSACTEFDTFEPSYSDCMGQCACIPQDDECPKGCKVFTECASTTEKGGFEVVACGRCIHPDGTVAEGAGCSAHAQCEPGLVCAKKSGKDAGVCLPPRGEGEACADDCTCDEGLVCNDALSPAVCAPLGDTDAPCDEDSECLGGLLCNAATSPAACLPAGPAGGACAEDADCGSGMECSTLEPPRCIPAGGPGARCSWPGGCDPGLLCRTVVPGAPTLCVETCESDDSCEPGMKCMGDMPPPYDIAWCRFPKKSPESCFADSECETACVNDWYCGTVCW